MGSLSLGEYCKLGVNLIGTYTFSFLFCLPLTDLIVLSSKLTLFVIYVGSY
jgi:hypothetical protein